MHHPVNIDAIQAGVTAFLQTYPSEAALDQRAPTGAPNGAHPVLWIDDFWRGVDMAREALESADFCAHRRSVYPKEQLRVAACRAADYAIVNGWEMPADLRDEISLDAIEVFIAQVGGLFTRGDVDWYRKDDPEAVADAAEPA